MQVLFVYKDYAPVFGGIENHIGMLARGLRARNIDARVLVTNTGRRTVQQNLAGVPVTKTGRVFNISSAPISFSFYPELARAEQGIDIAHLHFPYPPGEIGQLLLGKSRRFVLTYHSDIVKQKVLGFFYRPLLRQVLQQADLITVSNPIYIQTSPFLQPVAHKCRVIHHGANLDRFAPTPAIEQAAAQIRAQYPDKTLILFVGRLRHYKGVDVLISAMKDLPNAHALVVGIGPMADTWQAWAQSEQVSERVTFLGEISDAELIATYHAADIFTLPSTNRAETWGAVQIEAMACGLPIVCTELGTGTSYVNQHGQTGLVVPPSDPAALAAAFAQLIDKSDLRQQMGQAGYQRAQQQFSTTAMIDQLLAFYQEALEIPR